MKKLKYLIFGAMGALALPFALSSCSPDDIEGLNENNLPLAADANVTVDVDQTTNQVTFNMAGDGIYPIWYMTWESANPYSTVNGYTKVVNAAGDYELDYRVGNRNGMSQGMGSTTFHIDNSLVNFDMYLTMLSGKTWRIASDETGHLGCGESGSDGLNWYSAQPNEKADYGIYDDELTFGDDYSYTYSPGADGLMFVNTGCTVFDGNPGDGNDFDTPAEAQSTTFQLVGEGTNVYIVLPAGTNFPYVSCDDQYNDPRFRIESITSTRLVLIYDNGSIAWHFILTSAEGEETFDGFDPDSDCNMFKSSQYSITYYYAPNWSEIDAPSMTQDGNSYTVSLPEATSEKWQAQMLFHTDMTTNAATDYDFSCKLMSTTDHNNVTVKLCDTDNSGSYYFEETVSLNAYEEYVFYKSGMSGIDMSLVDVVFDFGGNSANTDVTISDIVLKENGCDDGRTPPAEETDDTEYIYDAETNLWKTNVDDTDNYTAEFYYAPGWVQIDDPTFTKDGGTYTISLPTATSDQWQAQVKITSGIHLDAETSYDFSCTLMSDKEIKGVTIKPADSANDADNYLFAERVDLAPYEEYVFKMPASVMTMGATDGLMLVFDFGGNADDTNITISNIIVQKTAE